MKNLFAIWEDLDRRFGAGVFYTALVLMLCSYAWFSFRVWNNEMHEILIFIRRLPLILFGIRIVLLGGRHPKYMLGCLLVSAVLFMSSRITDNRELLRLGMAVMASREVRNRVTVRIYQGLYLLVPLAGLILYLLGIAFDLQTHELGMEGHSWGLINPNVLAMLLFGFLLSVLLYIPLRRNGAVLAVCWTAAAVIWVLTLSKAVVLVLVLLPLFYMSLKKWKPSASLLALAPWGGLLLSVALLLYFGPSDGESTFESRFSIPYLSYQEHGLTWLGHRISPVAEDLPLDNVYLRHFLISGILPGACVLTFYSHYLYRMGQVGNPMLLAMQCSVLLIGFMEFFPLDIVRNFLILFYFIDEDGLRFFKKA